MPESCTGKRHWTYKLTRLGACLEAVEWASQFTTVQEAWAVCTRGGWLVWLCRKVPTRVNNKRAYVRTALAIAESVKESSFPVPEAEAARKATQDWLNNPSAKTRAAAARAADAARVAAGPAYASDAVYTATYAAYAAASPAYNAVYAVRAAANAVACATYTPKNKKIADIIRRFLTCPKLRKLKSRKLQKSTTTD